MRRGLMIGGAWVAATGAAITLSWFGVDAVLKGTVYDPPRAHPVAGASADAGPLPEPDASSTQRPPPDASPAPDASTPAAGGTTPSAAPPREPADRSPRPPAEPTGYPSPAGGLGSVETVRTEGGRVAFDLGESAAELVSATPEPGWDMQVWTEDHWIRVTFTAGSRELSVFCLWHDSAPRIERHESA